MGLTHSGVSSGISSSRACAGPRDPPVPKETKTKSESRLRAIRLAGRIRSRSQVPLREDVLERSSRIIRRSSGVKVHYPITGL